jgi:hypothetical protein
MKKTFNDQENCLVISDVDGVADYGFISLIIECIKESEVPIICICDNRYDLNIKPILSFCVDMKLTPPSYEEVYPLLYKIIVEEKIKINKKELFKLYEESNGDIRYMLNTLQLFIKKKDMHKDIQNTNIFEIANKLLSLELFHPIKAYSPLLVPLVLYTLNSCDQTPSLIEILPLVSVQKATRRPPPSQYPALLAKPIFPAFVVSNSFPLIPAEPIVRALPSDIVIVPPLFSVK